jgi:geranylgeranyl diphosphate synthase type I
MAGTAAELPHIRAQVGRALADFVAQQRDVLGRIDASLLQCLDAVDELVTGGKRLRPAFCYWGWRAAGREDCPQILTAAAALELLHASALVHDDVMDGSDTRRGRPSVHRRFAGLHEVASWRGSAEAFGTGAAILVGDLLLAWTDELFHGSGLPQAALQNGRSVLDAMRTEVFSGQYLDLIGQASGAATVAAALRVVVYKSAKYTVERPLHLGAELARATRPGTAGPRRTPDDPVSGHGDRLAARQAFTDYGIPIGIAFQLRDDILGVFGDPAKTGKPVIDDLREGKRTVMLAIARERADPDQAAVLDRAIGDPLLSEQGARQVRAVITGTGALAECEAMIDRNVKDALSALDAAPITAESRSALADLAVAATARTD